MSPSNEVGELTDRILTELQTLLAEPDSGAEQPLRERLRPRLVELLQQSQPADASVAGYDATLVLVQLCGMGQLTQTFSAAVAVDALSRFLTMMSELVLGHGAAIEGLSGSTLRAVFGAPQPAPEHIEQAVACSIAMQQAMGRFNRENRALGLPEFHAGVVVDSGLAQTGISGSGSHRQFGALDEQISRLGRNPIEGLRGQILLGENAYRRAKDFILVGDARELDSAGQPAPARVYELMGTTRPRPMTVPRREQRKSPRVAVAMACYFQHQVGQGVLTTVHSGEVIDLGYYGLQMTCGQRLEPGTSLRLELSPFLSAGKTTWVLARVIDTEPAPGGYRCRLEFIDDDNHGRQAIRKLVDSLVFQG